MNKAAPIVALLLALAFGSCNNDLDLAYYADPVPVVFGVLCPQDSVHRILIRRSFICGDSVEYYAKQPDSVLFGTVQVNMEVRSDEGSVLERYNFLPETFGPRDEGFFASEPNILYAARPTQPVNPLTLGTFEKYTLTAYFPEIDKSIIAETWIPPVLRLASPARMDPFVMDMLVEQTIRFVWQQSQSYNIEMVTVFNYLEEINYEWIPKSIKHKKTYPHLEKNQYTSREELSLNGEWFYPMVGGRIKKDPSVSARKFVSIDFLFFTIAAGAYDNYLYTQYPTDYSESTFSNIINGQGLFTAYSRLELKGFTLTTASLDTLISGKDTRDLGFVRW